VKGVIRGMGEVAVEGAARTEGCSGLWRRRNNIVLVSLPHARLFDRQTDMQRKNEDNKNFLVCTMVGRVCTRGHEHATKCTEVCVCVCVCVCLIVFQPRLYYASSFFLLYAPSLRPLYTFESRCVVERWQVSPLFASNFLSKNFQDFMTSVGGRHQRCASTRGIVGEHRERLMRKKEEVGYTKPIPKNRRSHR
jgi:hypothetical protein